jgi:O-antigen/teichoic acid export membrane protein
MLTSKVANPVMVSTEQRSTFFRQSGWLMIANIGGGIFMWVVHFLSKAVGPQAYGEFITFLAVAMCIPAIPLQMVMAQQTAKALATGRERELTGMIRIVWLWTFLIWLGVSLLVVVFRHSILERWGIARPTGLWVALPIYLFSIWVPIFWGVLQGRQHFLWLGWSMMINGFGRLVAAVLAVIVLAGLAAGMLTGVLFGLITACSLAIWETRALWSGSSLPFAWGPLLRQVIPLMLGFAAFQFLFTADTIFAKAYFDADTVGFYGSAGTLSRALMWLVGPLAAVMFPRIVHSASKAEKSDLMGAVLLGTGILAVAGAISLSILGPFIVRIVSGKEFVEVASSLLPWYAGAMVPLSLANVLLNNLMARSSFRAVPLICLLVIGYGFALTQFHETPVSVLKTLTFFSVLVLAVCAWFNWQFQREAKNSPSTSGAV